MYNAVKDLGLPEIFAAKVSKTYKWAGEKEKWWDPTLYNQVNPFGADDYHKTAYFVKPNGYGWVCFVFPEGSDAAKLKAEILEKAKANKEGLIFEAFDKEKQVST